ncbi:putative virulence associated protein virE [Escherichia coli]|uniref:Putative virulence associated protein virE n=1 Tax=Escherichia coli TaxID=562 RepID=A0A377DNF2_ECOLX|nr:putative virulence associated protein virE [Escherichia coli]
MNFREIANFYAQVMFLRDAIGLNPDRIGKREEMRISNVLQNCGYKRAQRRIGGKKCKVWEPLEPRGTT